eukprot:TRINITY_DN9441_c0_g2_i3.p1 TRINITY_DN9441_c0_g2~~TRINITY_DN9441_c0_g2_i3.p1  ORF type:complete len:529 (+),score=47.12 TRINITY_DN9441_c0_g2_i3:183-1769(+)
MLTTPFCRPRNVTLNYILYGGQTTLPLAPLRVVGRRADKQRRKFASIGCEAECINEKSETVQNQSARKVLIVGGGPVGLTCAMHMLKLGMHVEVLEKRTEPSIPEVKNAKEFSVSINQRGILAMETAGFNIQQLLGQSNRFKQMITIDNKKARNTSMANRQTYYVNRSELVALLNNAINASPNRQNITFHYNTVIENFDAKSKIATFRGKNNCQINCNYDLLIGADGMNSLVRDQLSNQCPQFEYDVEYISKFIFRIATKLPREGLLIKMSELGQPINEDLEGKILVNYAAQETDTRSRMIGWTESDRSCSILVYASTHDPVLSNKDSLTEDFQIYLRDYFGDLITEEWIQVAAEQLAKNPVRNQGKLIRCNQFHGPGVILIGDAAHCTTPLLGQGLNSGLEDCQILSQLLQDPQIPFENIPQIYTQKRLLNIYAIQNFEGAIYRLAANHTSSLSYKLFQSVLMPGILISNIIGTQFETWLLGYQLQEPSVSQNQLQYRFFAIGGIFWVSILAGFSLLVGGAQFVPAL